MATVVAKIGSSSITDEQGVIDRAALAKLCDEIAALRAFGHRVVLVTSGAIAAGLPALGMTRAQARDTATLQAISAVGQSRLMRVYDEVFAALATVGFDGVISSCVFGWEEDADGVNTRQRDKAQALIDKHLTH